MKKAKVMLYFLLAFLSLVAGYVFMANAPAKDVIYTYQYTEGPDNCGVSGECQLAVYRGPWKILQVGTYGAPIFYNSGIRQIHSSFVSNKELDFTVFLKECKPGQAQYQCDINPVTYKGAHK